MGGKKNWLKFSGGFTRTLGCFCFLFADQLYEGTCLSAIFGLYKKKFWGVPKMAKNWAGEAVLGIFVGQISIFKHFWPTFAHFLTCFKHFY